MSNEIKWNPDQIHAIEGRKGTMLVSAAAGSGKTAVLVERVIQRLCDKENPCTIDELLIVTFTKAAATQMKEKIAKALDKKIAEDPLNSNILKKNKLLLPYVDIGTIDSFCINLIRNNFHLLDISPDFKIMEEAEEKIIEKKALMSVITKYHSEKTDDFNALLDLLNDENKNDINLQNIMKMLRSTSLAYEFPEEWLRNLCNNYEADCPLKETTWGKIFIKRALDYCNHNLNIIDYLSELIKGDEKTEAKYSSILNEDMQNEMALISSLENESWDEIGELYSKINFKKNSDPKGENPQLYEDIKLIRTYNKSAGINAIFSIFSNPEEDTKKTIKELLPAVRTLIDAVIDFQNEIITLKHEKNAYTFDDTRMFTIQLLLKKENGKTVKTDFAKEYCKNYKEILVDEYQDVSKAQNMIFWALSNDDTNRFMVGDVKQSIYSFRKAMPEVFTDLRKNMTDYDGEHYPARVSLTSNYRSRKGVTNAINFFFDQLMTEEMGGVDYDIDERLNPEANYPDREGNDTEIWLFETENDKVAVQAEKIAEYIENEIKNKAQVTESNGITRDVTYSDFAVLYRSGSCLKSFLPVFDKADIPYSVKNEQPYLTTPEISFLISLLKIIDNPINDIPLTTVMMSPVYGFTADDLAKMRISKRKGKLYSCVTFSAENGNERAIAFVESLKKLRRIAATSPAGEFTSRIIEETGYRAIVSAMKDGSVREQNINSFINLAYKYETTGVKGISGFVRFLDRIDDNAVKTTTNVSTSSDSVQMMTIHKSKGLEFPYVFLINTEKKYNEEDIKNTYIVTQEAGLGLKIVKGNAVFDTVPFLAAKESYFKQNHSEELRILYVALTRAKEKLLILGSINSKEKTEKAILKYAIKGCTPGSFAVSQIKCYLELILLSCFFYEGNSILEKNTGINITVFKDKENAEEIIKADSFPEYSPDIDRLKEIKERLSYVYPYEYLNGITAKQIASKLNSGEFDDRFFASSRPSLANKGGLTAAQKGIATHRFMQYADYDKATISVDSELLRLVKEELLTEKEAASVDTEAVSKFFISPLAERISKAEKVFKEYPFICSLPLKYFYPEITDENDNEKVVIEGVVDFAFIEDGKLIIVDFKTDHAHSDEELINNYKNQLSTYRECMKKVLNIEVKETLIYSFVLNKQIEIK